VHSVLVVESQRSRGIGSRVDGYVVRAPYVAAAVLFAALAFVFDTFRRLHDAHGQRGWLDWVVVGFVLYACVALVLLPRLVARGRKTPSVSVALIRSAVAVCPCVIGIGAWSIGADEWAAVAAFVASTALLLVAARITASQHPSPA